MAGAEHFCSRGTLAEYAPAAAVRQMKKDSVRRLLALCDELAPWPTDDAADPNYAVIDALRPGMAQFPNAMLLCARSPYARRGALHDAYERHYGQR
jgi:hypothetical protein